MKRAVYGGLDNKKIHQIPLRGYVPYFVLNKIKTTMDVYIRPWNGINTFLEIVNGMDMVKWNYNHEYE